MQDKKKNVPPDLPVDLQEQEKLYQTIENLERDLEKERDERKEERFYWILAGVTLFDSYIFIQMPTAIGILAIVGFQLAGLTFLAKKMDIKEAVRMLDSIKSMVRSSS